MWNQDTPCYDKRMHIVYFSSVTRNTEIFVHNLGYDSTRIPIDSKDSVTVTQPYVLVTPTYGGGETVHGKKANPVPIQVVKFLNNPENRKYIRGVIAGGNRNFGADFGVAGDVVSQKCNVPCLHRFELQGTQSDIDVVQQGIEVYAHELGLN